MTKRKPKELLKTKRYDISQDKLDELWELYKSGMSMNRIAKISNIGYWTIRDRFYRAGYKPRNRSDAYELALKEGRIGGSNRGKFGEESSVWKGGKIKDKYGYIHLRMPNHPRAAPNGYVREHLVIWETYMEKSMPDGWHIHHINGNKSDNRIENLLALPSREHGLIIPYLSKRIKELEDEIKDLKEQIK